MSIRSQLRESGDSELGTYATEKNLCVLCCAWLSRSFVSNSL